MIDSIFEFIYTKLLANKRLKRFVNYLILFLLPSVIKRFGVYLALNKTDPVVSGALFFRVYENEEIRLISSIARTGMKFLDVGANIGLYTTVISKIVGSSGAVYSFEPEPESYGYLEKNIELNQLRNVSSYQCALSDHVGSEKLYASINNGGDNRLYNPVENLCDFRSYDISVTTADTLLNVDLVKEIDLVKIDVQGYEYRVLNGMAGLIRRSTNVIIFTEFWPDGIRCADSDPNALLGMMTSLDLNAYDIRTGKSYTRFEQMIELVNLYRGRKYTNLIFSRDLGSLALA